MDIRTQLPSNRGDLVARFGEAWKAQVATLRQKFAEQITEVKMPIETAVDMPTVFVAKESIVDVLRFAKSEPGFEYGMLTDITATDETPEMPRFHVVYHLFSVNRHWRIRFKARVGENETLPTVIPVWPAANWAEREVWDMYGVRFDGHPDLRRILMDERWVGHPLRKDYPLRGYQVFTEPQVIDPKLLD
jgi:NADH-quinone oxidoreductase subunit C